MRQAKPDHEVPQLRERGSLVPRGHAVARRARALFDTKDQYLVKFTDIKEKKTMNLIWLDYLFQDYTD